LGRFSIWLKGVAGIACAWWEWTWTVMMGSMGQAHTTAVYSQGSAGGSWSVILPGRRDGWSHTMLLKGTYRLSTSDPKIWNPKCWVLTMISRIEDVTPGLVMSHSKNPGVLKILYKTGFRLCGYVWCIWHRNKFHG
jgi:hypothetical protein